MTDRLIALFADRARGIGWESGALAGVDSYAMCDRPQGLADTPCLAGLCTVLPEAKINVRIEGHVPGFAAKADTEVVTLPRNRAGQKETVALSHAIEASLFHEAGVPGVICGPGAIAQAHTPNVPTGCTGREGTA